MIVELLAGMLIGDLLADRGVDKSCIEPTYNNGRCNFRMSGKRNPNCPLDYCKRNVLKESTLQRLGIAKESRP